MNASDPTRSQCPCLFLFDSGASGVKKPALQTFTGALLDAISIADPCGTITAELRGGLPMLSEFAEQLGEVSSGPSQSSHTKIHDMALYQVVLWDLAGSLSEEASSPDLMAILDVL